MEAHKPTNCNETVWESVYLVQRLQIYMTHTLSSTHGSISTLRQSILESLCLLSAALTVERGGYKQVSKIVQEWLEKFHIQYHYHKCFVIYLLTLFLNSSYFFFILQTTWSCIPNNYSWDLNKSKCNQNCLSNAIHRRSASSESWLCKGINT